MESKNFSSIVKSGFQKMRFLPKRNKCNLYAWGKNTPTERKDDFSGKHLPFRGNDEKERNVMKSNNQINIPQAREAMDRFKMQAASDEGVSSTS